MPTETAAPAIERLHVTVGTGRKVHAEWRHAGTEQRPATSCGAEGRNPLARSMSPIYLTDAPVTCNACTPGSDTTPAARRSTAPTQTAEQMAANVAAGRVKRVEHVEFLTEAVARLTREGRYELAAQAAAELPEAIARVARV
jgi:hypothetical protein